MQKDFPEDFLWGASTSAHQVEGNNFFNDWWRWESGGGTCPSGKACDHYNRYKEDFTLAKNLGHNAHRVSLEWSRLEKDMGVWDDDEWDHYKKVIDELLEQKIEPIVTLHHFTLPTWLADIGGWTNEKTIARFSLFAEKAISELGPRVKYWITINEPNILAFLGYYYGKWTPCKKDFNLALTAIKNMLKAHVIAYKKMKECSEDADKVKIGLAKAVTAFHPCSSFSLLSRLCAHYRNKFHNHSFILSAIKGVTNIPGVKKEKLAAKNTLDFIGLNYYFRQFIHYNKNSPKIFFGEACSLDHHKNAGATTDMGWEIYPKGIYEVVKSFSKYDLPIMITENGIATTVDYNRRFFIKDHLTHLAMAIREGLPVIGYLHWSLLDNFEWAEAYSKRFGLINIDFNTQNRTVRDSAWYLMSVIENGKV